MSTSPGLGAILRVLRQSNFGIYTAGNAVSLIGTWMQRIAIGWLTWELTGSGTWLGIVAFADLCPSLLVGPPAGALADRVSPLKVTTVSQGLAMGMSLLLFALTAIDLMAPYLLATIVFVNGVVLGVNQPARLALVPSLVRSEDLSTAVAINSVVFNIARFIGPAIAGVLIATVGIESAFAVNAASFVAFLLALFRIRLPAEPRPPRGSARPSIFRDVGEGIRFTFAHPGIGPMLLLLAVTGVLIRPVIELLPGFAADVFERGATGLAILSSSVGVGAIAGGLWLARRGSAQGLTRVALASTLALALSTAAFVATEIFWFSVLCLVFGGLTMVVSGVAAQTLIQVAVPRLMRGRVLSLYGLIFRGGPALGALGMGFASEWVGLRPPLLAGALITTLFWSVVWRRRGRIAASLETPGAS